MTRRVGSLGYTFEERRIESVNEAVVAAHRRGRSRGQQAIKLDQMQSTIYLYLLFAAGTVACFLLEVRREQDYTKRLTMYYEERAQCLAGALRTNLRTSALTKDS